MLCYFRCLYSSRAPAALLNVLLSHMPLQALPRVRNKAAQAPNGLYMAPAILVVGKIMMKTSQYILSCLVFPTRESASTAENLCICRTKAVPIQSWWLHVFSIHLKLAHRNNPNPTLS